LISFLFQEDVGILDCHVTGVQTCALPIYLRGKYSDAKFIVDTLYSGKAPIREEYDYVRNSFGYKMYATDMKHQMSSLLHNASHARGKEKQMAARIQDYMRKHSLNVEELAFKVREIIRKTDGKE